MVRTALPMHTGLTQAVHRPMALDAPAGVWVEAGVGEVAVEAAGDTSAM